MFCTSMKLLVFIRILLMHLAEKTLIAGPLNFGVITPEYGLYPAPAQSTGGRALITQDNCFENTVTYVF